MILEGGGPTAPGWLGPFTTCKFCKLHWLRSYFLTMLATDICVPYA